LYQDKSSVGATVQDWAASVPHPFVELKLESIDPSLYIYYGESAGDAIEIGLDAGLIPEPDTSVLPDIPARLLESDVSQSFRDDYRLAQVVQLVKPAVTLQSMSLNELAEHTVNIFVQIANMNSSQIVRGNRAVEDVLSNEDSISKAAAGATSEYQGAFLDLFDVLQNRILYTGLGFVGFVLLYSSVAFSIAVCSLGRRTRLLLRAVTLVPRRVARIIRDDAQQELNRMLEDAQDDDGEGMMLDIAKKGEPDGMQDNQAHEEQEGLFAA